MNFNFWQVLTNKEKIRFQGFHFSTNLISQNIINIPFK